MNLPIELYDVYGQKIASRGAGITGRFVRDLARRGAPLSRKTMPVGKTRLLQDFKQTLRDARYDGVFSKPQMRETTFATFSRLKLPEPIVLELEQMKRHLPETYRHVLVMAALVIKMIRDMKSSRYDPLLAARLCLMHDIGKTRIPSRILNKKSELTLEQYRIIQTHPVIGYLLLKYYCGRDGERYARAAFEHHEKLDSSGYPRGIKKIDRYARLIAPVDIYDALISQRPYRTISYNGRLAVDILLEDAAKGKLDKASVYLLVNCLREEKVRSLAMLKVSLKRRSAPPPHNVYGKIKRQKARRLLRKD